MDGSKQNDEVVQISQQLTAKEATLRYVDFMQDQLKLCQLRIKTLERREILWILIGTGGYGLAGASIAKLLKVF